MFDKEHISFILRKLGLWIDSNFVDYYELLQRVWEVGGAETKLGIKKYIRESCYKVIFKSFCFQENAFILKPKTKLFKLVI